MPRRKHIWNCDSGQATVEFIALVPVILMLGWSVWQAALAGITAQQAARSAHSAARFRALGGSPSMALRQSLPSGLVRVARITQTETAVTVKLPVPSVIPGFDLGTVSATAAFPRQT